MSLSRQKNHSLQAVSCIFAFFTFWWLWLFLFVHQESSANLIFGALYGTTLTLFGTVVGLFFAKRWGGWSSLIGRAMVVLSLGLCAQFFGQAVFSFYNIVRHVEVPYPSIADVGFFGSIPLYIYGMWLLGRASGASIKKNSPRQHVSTLLIPIFLLGFSSLIFLRSYQFDTTQPLLIFLDFGYPLGQAVYVSIALLCYVLSKSLLGGVLRENILFFIYAFLVQYIADFNFLYQNLHGTWYNGGYGDFLYLLAYFLMAVALIQFGAAYKKIQGGGGDLGK